MAAAVAEWCQNQAAAQAVGQKIRVVVVVAHRKMAAAPEV
jgi:hypothetical protein